ncbi:MAG: carbamate kinase [Deltaproteobacteria bacterium]|nr:carbamate kinase [Deltaproteobacteria bacterium]
MSATRIIAIALGGNAISPPRGALAFDEERALIDRAASELAVLAGAGNRLLIVHGNGPQVGRLLNPGDHSTSSAQELDIRVAQTQGELGYLIVDALDRHLGGPSAVAVITRVLVDPHDAAFATPTKSIGPVLSQQPAGPAVRLSAGGWRRVVASPRPLAVVEETAISALLSTHHVVAGGGGGVPLGSTPASHPPQAAVVDKDWVAALLAVKVGAAELIFVTDVEHACDGFESTHQRPIERMTTRQAQEKLAAGAFAPGSMAPKIEAAITYAANTGRGARIAALGSIAAARDGKSGTLIVP